MLDRRDLARGWLTKGDSDLRTAELLVASDGPYDTACFHAQQAIEKYLKALLAYAGASIPFTHNLEDLEVLCVGLYPRLDLSDIDVSELTPFAVELRYDFEFWPSRDDTSDAVATTRSVRQAVLTVLPASVHPGN